ncbi:MAG: hypothetical protein IPP40_18165 [bacterium]|nr:hypothetical protein [bacterium]
MEQFQTNSLGEMAQSWVSAGENLPFPPDRLVKVFGQDKLSGLADKAGWTWAKFLPILTAALPLISDKFTHRW